MPVLVLGLTYRDGVKELAYSRAAPAHRAARLRTGAVVSAYDPLLGRRRDRPTVGATPYRWGDGESGPGDRHPDRRPAASGRSTSAASRRSRSSSTAATACAASTCPERVAYHGVGVPAAPPVRIVSVVGTRPQLIKAAALQPVLRARHQDVFVDTGQHYDEAMAGSFFAELGLARPDHSLGIGGGGHGEQTGRMLDRARADPRGRARPTPSSSTATRTRPSPGRWRRPSSGIPVAHVEAGLRSFDRRMPEEINRVVADHLARWLFAPTPTAVANLAAEGIVDGVAAGRRPDAGPRGAGRGRGPRPGRRSARSGERARRRDPAARSPGGYLFATIHRAENREPAAIARLGRRSCGAAARRIDRSSWPSIRGRAPRSRRRGIRPRAGGPRRRAAGLPDDAGAPAPRGRRPHRLRRRPARGGLARRPVPRPARHDRMGRGGRRVRRADGRRRASTAIGPRASSPASRPAGRRGSTTRAARAAALAPRAAGAADAIVAALDPPSGRGRDAGRHVRLQRRPGDARGSCARPPTLLAAGHQVTIVGTRHAATPRPASERCAIGFREPPDRRSPSRWPTGWRTWRVVRAPWRAGACGHPAVATRPTGGLGSQRGAGRSARSPRRLSWAPFLRWALVGDVRLRPERSACRPGLRTLVVRRPGLGAGVGDGRARRPTSTTRHDLTGLAAALVGRPGTATDSRVVYDSHEIFLEVRQHARPAGAGSRAVLRALGTALGHEPRRSSPCQRDAVRQLEPARCISARRLVVVHNCPPRWDAAEIRRTTASGRRPGSRPAHPVVLYHGGFRPRARARADGRGDPGRAGLEACPPRLLGYGVWSRYLEPILAPQRVRPVGSTSCRRVPTDEVLAWVAAADVDVDGHPADDPEPRRCPRRTSCSRAWRPGCRSSRATSRPDAGSSSTTRTGPLGAVCDPTDPAAIAAAIRGILGLDPPARADLRARAACGPPTSAGTGRPSRPELVGPVRRARRGRRRSGAPTDEPGS